MDPLFKDKVSGKPLTVINVTCEDVKSDPEDKLRCNVSEPSVNPSLNSTCFKTDPPSRAVTNEMSLPCQLGALAGVVTALSRLTSYRSFTPTARCS